MIVLQFLIFSGRAFHSLGAATENALSPQVFRLHHDWTSRCLADERSDLEGLHAVSRSVRQRGASRLRYLKVIKRILKRMRVVRVAILSGQW